MSLNVSGGEMYANDVAIVNNKEVSSGGASNVLLSGFATLRDNGVGIVMRGDATNGSVTMNCARLLRNYYGIFGTDITLLIDPPTLNPGSTGLINPNAFVRKVNGSNTYTRYITSVMG